LRKKVQHTSNYLGQKQEEDPQLKKQRLRQKRVNAEMKKHRNVGHYGNTLDLVKGRRKAILTQLNHREEQYTDVRFL
jgi:hypothetical protein